MKLYTTPHPYTTRKWPNIYLKIKTVVWNELTDTKVVTKIYNGIEHILMFVSLYVYMCTRTDLIYNKRNLYVQN